MVFVRPHGTEIGRVFGFQPPTVFLGHAERMVARADNAEQDN